MNLFNVLIKDGKPVSATLIDIEGFKKTQSAEGLVVFAASEKESLKIAAKLIEKIRDSLSSGQ